MLIIPARGNFYAWRQGLFTTPVTIKPDRIVGRAHSHPHPIRGQASLLLPNFWLSEPRPLPVRVPRPCRSELPPSLRSSPSPAKPLRLRLVVRRTRQPPRRDRQGLAQHMGTGPYAPTEAPVPASSRLLRFPGWER